MTDREVTERREAVANAVATQRLEGLELDTLSLAELDRYARGEIEISDLLQFARKRVAAGEFRTVPAK